MSDVMRATSCVARTLVEYVALSSRKSAAGETAIKRDDVSPRPNGNAPPRVYDRVDTSSECLLGVFIKDSAAEAAHKRATTATTSLANFRKRSARARAHIRRSFTLAARYTVTGAITTTAV